MKLELPKREPTIDKPASPDVRQSDMEINYKESRRIFERIIGEKMEHSIKIPHSYGLSSLTLEKFLSPKVIADLIETNLKKPCTQIDGDELEIQIENLKQITNSLASLNPEVIKTVALPESDIEIAKVPENVTLTSHFLAKNICEMIDHIKQRDGVRAANEMVAQLVPELFPQSRRPALTASSVNLVDKTGELRVVEPGGQVRSLARNLAKGTVFALGMLEYTFSNAVLFMERLSIEAGTPRHVALPPFFPLKYEATSIGGAYVRYFKNTHDIKDLMDEVVKTDGLVRSALRVDKKTGHFLPEFDEVKLSILQDITYKKDEIFNLLKLKDIHLRHKPEEVDKATKQFAEKIDVIKKHILDKHFSDLDMEKKKWLDSVFENLSRSRMRLHLLDNAVNGFKLKDYISARLFSHGLGGGETQELSPSYNSSEIKREDPKTELLYLPSPEYFFDEFDNKN